MIQYIRNGMKITDLEQCFIYYLYKDNGDALDRRRKRSLKPTEQARQFIMVIVDGLNEQLTSNDDSQVGFVPGRVTTHAIIVFQQLQEKYLAMTKQLYMAFVDLEKAFDCLPQYFWWALGKLNVNEYIMQ